MSLVKSKQRVADHGEVFTPSWMVEAMLDLVKDETERIDARFLEPACGSGNFIVQILRRKLVAVERKYGKSDFERRHYALLGLMCIYGVELLADNMAECRANMLERTEHTWVNSKCKFCGAGQAALDRGAGLETHAYAFIHTDNIKTRMTELFGDDMQFDVIIGNPPYQLGSDGGTRDVPIYQHFVEQAKKLEPRFLSMVIPSRWMAAGLGLSEFRQAMLADRRIQALVDYPAASDVFPGVEVKAGVCYFLWNADHGDDCTVTTFRGGNVTEPTKRDLGEYDVFVRDSNAMPILRKVLQHGAPSINSILARDKEFGWTSNFDGFHEMKNAGDLPLYYIRKMKRDVGFIGRDAVTKSAHLIDTWKVLVPQAFNGGDSIPHQILGKPLIAPSPSVCTQSFLFFNVNSESAAKSIQSYYTTRFFRFLVSLRKITQHATHSTYTWVPLQEWNCTWTDNALYEKYGITTQEQAYIESQVRQMTLESVADE